MTFQELLANKVTLIDSPTSWTQVTQKEPQGTKNQFVTVFFMSERCGACVKEYKPVSVEFTKLWTKKQGTPHYSMEFVLFDIGVLAKHPEMNTIVKNFHIQVVPTILLLSKGESDQGPQLVANLKHKKTKPIESWLQHNFYPDKSVNEMVGTQAVYEVEKNVRLFQKSQKDSEEGQKIFDLLLNHFQDPFLDSHTLLKFFPTLFARYPKELNKLAEQVQNLSISSDWKLWFQSKIDEARHTRSLTLTGYEQLQPDETLRNFLVRKFYHFLSRHPILA